LALKDFKKDMLKHFDAHLHSHGRKFFTWKKLIAELIWQRFSDEAIRRGCKRAFAGLALDDLGIQSPQRSLWNAGGHRFEYTADLQTFARC